MQEQITKYNAQLNSWAADMLIAAWGTERVISSDMRAPFMSLIALPETRKMRQYEGSAGSLHLFRELSKRNVTARMTFDHNKKYLRLSSHVYNYPDEYLMLQEIMGKFLGFI